MGGKPMLKALYNFGKGKKGFTLIELLIVVAIIAILAAIAIPQFAAYRKRGYNASANSDLRNLRTTEEAMYADFQDYGWTNAAAANAATASVVGPGATQYLTSATTTTVTQSISLSPNAYAYARASSSTAGTKSSSYNAATGHGTGDTLYGAENDTTTLYRRNDPTDGTYVSTDFSSTAPNVSATGVDTWTASGWVALQ